MASEKQKISREVNKHGTIIYRNEMSQYHRDDGPAYEGANGIKEWYRNGRLHRDDGPAIEDVVDGTVEYWLNDQPWPEGPQIIDRRKKDAALAHMKGVFNGTIPVETTVISRLKIKPKPKPSQP